MTRTDRMVIVSADGHGGARPETYRQYLEQRYHADLDRLIAEDEAFLRDAAAFVAYSDEELAVIDPLHVMRDGRTSGAFDLDVRIAEMDREGIVAELLLPQTQRALLPFFATRNSPHDADLRMAGSWAYMRWLADFAHGATSRVLPVATPGPCIDIDETLRLLEFAATHGFVATDVPRVIDDPALPPLHDGYYEPFWRACNEYGFPIVVHAGHDRPQGETAAYTARLAASGMTRDEILHELHHSEDSPLALDMRPRRVLWQLMMSGAFDRYPDLHLVFTEVRADWVPGTLAHLDHRYDAEDVPMSMRPSEYWKRNCYVGLSFPHRAEADLRHDIGVDQIMFGRDYPHPEGTWPNTFDWLRDAFRGVPEDEARKIFGENAIECYGLDRTELAAIAERIGPKPNELLGEQPEIDGRLIAHFGSRGGYTKPAEVVDVERIDRLLDDDLALQS